MILSMLAIVQLCVKVKQSKQLPPKGKEKLFVGKFLFPQSYKM